ncbi:carboxymuconolactone decarboxylase family protein, partial [Mycobacteroides abscessus subsp. abscessus]|nr:carboxymuconolactone decarboxylase family protein [Mycobacteroides abscessus subsp. abscessus]
EFWERARQHFDDGLLTDLALSCAFWVGSGRALRVLDVGQSCKINL